MTRRLLLSYLTITAFVLVVLVLDPLAVAARWRQARFDVRDDRDLRLADLPPSTAAFYRCAYALPPLALLAWYERRRYGPRAAGQLRLAAATGGADG